MYPTAGGCTGWWVEVTIPETRYAKTADGVHVAYQVLGTGAVDMVDWVEAIPYQETRNYVQRVLENAVVYDLMNPARAKSRGAARLSWYLGKNRPG